MPSFDVVSELDKHEVTTAIDKAITELDRRYDL
ncbi:MAG TPA: YajQ family cyclic di-GMP-binding protein, partial [Pseudomonas sp.]|nr:YajQ family cyclic di-GMP-binding protein [Pseudomonas sp.]